MYFPKATLIIDLGYGDAGKGTIVDALTRRMVTADYNPTIVRFSGGSQCGHNVITEDGKHHCFSQFGSGMLRKGVKTYYSKYALLDLLALLNEAEHLKFLGRTDALANFYASPEVPIITGLHVEANRIKERLRGNGKHGSCGRGIGETQRINEHFPMELGILLKDLKLLSVQEIEERMIKLANLLSKELNSFISGDSFYFAKVKEDKLRDEYLLLDLDAPQVLRNAIQAEANALSKAAKEIRVHDDYLFLADAGRDDPLIFEGSQGLLLDRYRGFFPYVTYSDVSDKNAYKLLSGAQLRNEHIETIGVTRMYMVRHGAGPFPTEAPAFTAELTDANNPENPWQGTLRAGLLDIPALKYAAESLHHGLDSIAVTHLDAIKKIEPEICLRYIYGEQLPKWREDEGVFDRQRRSDIASAIDHAGPIERFPGKVPDPVAVARWIAARIAECPAKIASYGPRTDYKTFITDEQ